LHFVQQHGVQHLILPSLDPAIGGMRDEVLESPEGCTGSVRRATEYAEPACRPAFRSREVWTRTARGRSTRNCSIFVSSATSSKARETYADVWPGIVELER
jgi:hypothetical protein